jgi:hypothetical protein
VEATANVGVAGRGRREPYASWSVGPIQAIGVGGQFVSPFPCLGPESRVRQCHKHHRMGWPRCSAPLATTGQTGKQHRPQISPVLVGARWAHRCPAVAASGIDHAVRFASAGVDQLAVSAVDAVAVADPGRSSRTGTPDNPSEESLRKQSSRTLRHLQQSLHRLVGMPPSTYRRHAARATAGMPSCVAKQVTRPIRNQEARSPSRT